MSVKVKTSRANRSRSVLAQYGKLAKNVVATGGQLVRNTAVTSIQTHSGGEAVTRYDPRRTHTASRAGDPPNTDTGFLASNIHLVIDADGFGCDVESRADYSAALEFGTSKMAARPFMQPALEENKAKIKKMYLRMKARGV
jgi:HK97 gp10 family phage protein